MATTKAFIPSDTKRSEIMHLQRELLALEQEDSNRAMSDDYWYSNGGHAALERQMRAVRNRIAALDR